MFFLMANRINPAVGFTTHYALYAGLMSDVEVIPDKETTGWAGRWAAKDVGGEKARVWDFDVQCNA